MTCAVADALYGAQAEVLGGQADAARSRRVGRRPTRGVSDGSLRMRARHRSTPYLLIAPALLVFGAIVLVPIGLTARFSFFRWDGLGPFEPVGLLNYRRAIQDPIFRSSFVHAAIYIAMTIVLEVVVGMALAGLLAARPKGGTFFRWPSSCR